MKSLYILVTGFLFIAVISSVYADEIPVRLASGEKIDVAEDSGIQPTRGEGVKVIKKSTALNFDKFSFALCQDGEWGEVCKNERIITTCDQYKKALSEGFSPTDNVTQSETVWADEVCLTYEIIKKKAKPSKMSFVKEYKINELALKVASLYINSESGNVDSDSVMAFKPTLYVLAPYEARMEFSEPENGGHDAMRLEHIASADFNSDGIEDMLFFVVNSIGTSRSSDCYIVTKLSESTDFSEALHPMGWEEINISAGSK